MIKLNCPTCGEDWKEFGNAYKRVESNKIDYYCNNCHGKRKPVRTEVATIPDEIGNFLWPMLDRKPEGIEVKVEPKARYNNILVIGDIHEPFCLEGYKEFCYKMYLKHNCTKVIFIGDIIDQHYSSFHNTDPDGLGGGTELDFAISKIQEWKKLFPVADVCLGNHDRIVLRKAFAAGISKKWIKDFKDVLEVDWNFQPSHKYYGILFRHGMGQKASPKAGSEFMSVVQGHFHPEAYIHYRVGRGKKVFGAQCPCGIDRRAYAMAYAEEHPKEAIGCLVIKENGKSPLIEMMDL